MALPVKPLSQQVLADAALATELHGRQRIVSSSHQPAKVSY